MLDQDQLYRRVRRGQLSARQRYDGGLVVEEEGVTCSTEGRQNDGKPARDVEPINYLYLLAHPPYSIDAGSKRCHCAACTQDVSSGRMLAFHGDLLADIDRGKM